MALKLRMPVEELIATYLAEHDLAVFDHPRRHCIYVEADACIQGGKDDPETIRDQIKRYRYEGYPPLAGLAECTVLLRRHTERMKLFSEVWWDEISRHSRRDQLSFNYVAWKLSFTYKTLPGCVEQNDFFERRPHLVDDKIASPGPEEAGPAGKEAGMLKSRLIATDLENFRLRQSLHLTQSAAP